MSCDFTGICFYLRRPQGDLLFFRDNGVVPASEVPAIMGKIESAEPDLVDTSNLPLSRVILGRVPSDVYAKKYANGVPDGLKELGVTRISHDIERHLA